MSDHSEQTADHARILAEQARALSRADDHRGAYNAMREAVTIYQGLLETGNGNGEAVSEEELERLLAERDRLRQVLIATLPPPPPKLVKEYEEMVAGHTIPAAEFLAEIERICRGGG